MPSRQSGSSPGITSSDHCRNQLPAKVKNQRWSTRIFGQSARITMVAKFWIPAWLIHPWTSMSWILLRIPHRSMTKQKCDTEVSSYVLGSIVRRKVSKWDDWNWERQVFPNLFQRNSRMQICDPTFCCFDRKDQLVDWRMFANLRQIGHLPVTSKNFSYRNYSTRTDYISIFEVWIRKQHKRNSLKRSNQFLHSIILQAHKWTFWERKT